MLLDFEKRLMDDTDLFEESVVETLRQTVQRQFEEKNRLLRRMTWSYYAIAIAILATGFLMMICFHDTKSMLMGAVTSLIGFVTMVFSGQLYSTHQSRISVMKELKELRIQVAELADRIPPQSAGEGGRPEGT